MPRLKPQPIARYRWQLNGCAWRNSDPLKPWPMSPRNTNAKGQSMRNVLRKSLLICTLGISACASPLPPAPSRLLETPQIRLAPAPSDVMVRREADFLQNLMQRFSFPKPAEPTK